MATWIVRVEVVVGRMRMPRHLKFYHILVPLRRRSRRAWPGVWSSHAKERANLADDRFCDFDVHRDAPRHKRIHGLSIPREVSGNATGSVRSRNPPQGSWSPDAFWRPGGD